GNLVLPTAVVSSPGRLDQQHVQIMIFQNLFPVVRPEGDQIAFWLDTSGGEFVKDDTKRRLSFVDCDSSPRACLNCLSWRRNLCAIWSQIPISAFNFWS